MKLSTPHAYMGPHAQVLGPLEYWNRSRPCIILDSKIPRLVLEAFPKVLIFQQFFLDQNIQKGSNRVILKDLNFC